MGVTKKKSGGNKAAPAKGKSTGGKLTNKDKILQAIASQHAMGKEKPDKKMVQGLAGIPDKKIFDTVCGTMKSKDKWISYDKDTIELTEKGRDQVGEEALQVPTNNDALHDKIKEQLKSKRSREIFDILADGRAYSKEEIAKRMGVELNKSFGTYLSGLSNHTERVEGGKYRLKDDVFLVGRPCDNE